jgi:hypothetical protein
MLRRPTSIPWCDGDCRGRDLSNKEASELESRFAEPIWARVEQLRLEEQRRLEEEQRRLEEELLEQQRQEAEYTALFGDTYPGMTYSDLYADVESSAAAAFVERNDKRPLAKLLDPRHPFNAYEPRRRRIRESLSEQTYLLAAKVISGELKHKGGRPEKGLEKNLDTASAKVRHTTAAAASSVPLLRKALRAAYPRPRRVEISERAVYMAGEKYRVGEHTIENYLDRSKSLRLPD